MLSISNAQCAQGGLPPDITDQAYNALDSAITFGVAQPLLGRLCKSPSAQLVYAFERAMQGPAFTMAVRGIAVDEIEAGIQARKAENEERRCREALEKAAAVWDMPSCNPNSPAQVRQLLFDCTGENPYQGGTTSEDALRMYMAKQPPALSVLANLVLRIRETRKLQSFLKAKRSPDGRLRSRFNVGATTSGRWSFGKDNFGDGLNFGNIPKSARAIFIPSTPSRVMVNADLKQAESLVVAHLCNDPGYIRAHETGDAHSAVALDLWPGMDPRAPFLRGWTRRDAAKRIGHGTNYGIGERKSSKVTGLPIQQVVDFRTKYFAAYPGIKARIDGMTERLCNGENITHISAIGRPHQYLGNPRDPETARKALADEPQGIVADVLNAVMWRLWRRHDVGHQHPRMWLLSQGYDSILLECEAADVEAVRSAVADAFNIPIHINSTFIIGHDFGYGRNWKEAC